MKKVFYSGLALFIVFELLNVYFIMPLPGSQDMNSLAAAYIVHSYRWAFRIPILLFIIWSSFSAFTIRIKWIPAVFLIVTAVIVYMLNFRMAADKMFLQPHNVVLKGMSENKVDGSILVLGVEKDGEAKAYPVRFLAYHHQVQDSLGGKPIIVTYCSVCRTGRVFEPVVNGHHERFRLVGMDHFNAMFEDATTKSWWRQATGEAVAGPLKGRQLPELISMQMTVKKWFELYPDGRVMQPEEISQPIYTLLAPFEAGKSKSRLLHTDSISWKEKSWVVGLKAEGQSNVYDWNELKKSKVINGMVGEIPVVVVLSGDGQSFAAFVRPSFEKFVLNHDTLFSGGSEYDFSGKDLQIPSHQLKKIQAYQEYWHSWRNFH